MATQQEKTVTTTAKANSAHGLRDLFEVGLGYLLCRKNIRAKHYLKWQKCFNSELTTTLNKH
jgi:hypothetical protein